METEDLLEIYRICEGMCAGCLLSSANRPPRKTRSRRIGSWLVTWRCPVGEDKSYECGRVGLYIESIVAKVV
jgi:hypothetical protein